MDELKIRALRLITAIAQAPEGYTTEWWPQGPRHESRTKLHIDRTTRMQTMTGDPATFAITTSLRQAASTDGDAGAIHDSPSMPCNWGMDDLLDFIDQLDATDDERLPQINRDLEAVRRMEHLFDQRTLKLGHINYRIEDDTGEEGSNNPPRVMVGNEIADSTHDEWGAANLF